ncbi:MAG: MauE/DoxX family redox-associated membrane protein [Phycisphaerales bacterium]
MKSIIARGFVRSIVAAARLGTGLLFVWSGLGKIERPHEFLLMVYGYEIVDAGAGLLVAMFLPWLEIVIGLSLLLSRFLLGAFVCGFVLLVAFLAAQLHALAADLEIECGCWGSLGSAFNESSARISGFTAARTGVLAVVLGCLTLFQWRRERLGESAT